MYRKGYVPKAEVLSQIEALDKLKAEAVAASRQQTTPKRQAADAADLASVKLQGQQARTKKAEAERARRSAGRSR